jgi:ATP-dependent RNA helicase SrmB
LATFLELGIHTRIIENLAAQSILEPTPVQDQVIPILQDGFDALVCAETGSGKTLAYVVPAVNDLAEDRRLLGADSPHALILVPTRELAQQVVKEIELACEGTGARVALVTGGQEFRYQASLLRRNPELVVATPGRLAEHLEKESLSIAKVRCLVLDEADRMLDMGFRDDVLAITSRIEPGHQTVMLSATLKHRGIAQIAGELLKEPKLVQLSSAREVNANVKLEMILADDTAHKLRLLTWLLANKPFTKALVFVKTRESVESVTSALQKHGHSVRFLHGELAQDVRRKIMAGYREGRFKVLVATDLAARGLDVSGLELVVNFDMAQSGEEFVHRAGRTGRAGQEGLLISLVSSTEWNLSASIQRYLNTSFEQTKIPGLEGNYKGPKKLKSSGKAAGTKKKKTKEKDKPAKKAEAGKKPKRPAGAAKPTGAKAGKKKAPDDKKGQDGGFSSFRRPPVEKPEGA